MVSCERNPYYLLFSTLRFFIIEKRIVARFEVVECERNSHYLLFSTLRFFFGSSRTMLLHHHS